MTTRKLYSWSSLTASSRNCEVQLESDAGGLKAVTASPGGFPGRSFFLSIGANFAPKPHQIHTTVIIELCL